MTVPAWCPSHGEVLWPISGFKESIPCDLYFTGSLEEETLLMVGSLTGSVFNS